MTYLSFDDRLELGLASIDDMPSADQVSLLGDKDLVIEELPKVTETVVAEAIASQITQEPKPVEPAAVTSASFSQAPKVVKIDGTAPMCYNCGNQTQRSGSCYVCTSCGSTTGCS